MSKSIACEEHFIGMGFSGGNIIDVICYLIPSITVPKGMLIAIPEEYWVEFRKLSTAQLIKLLKMLSKKVKLSRFKKHPWGPKKTKPKRVFDPKHPHVSTAKLIANRKK